MIRTLLVATSLATLASMGAYAQEAPTATDNSTKPAASAQSGAGHLATSIIGEEVYNGTGDDAQNIGEVNDIVITKDGGIEAVVVGVGGFLGIGEKDVAVDYSELSWAERDGDRWLVTKMTKEQLQTQGAFDRTAYDTAAGATGSDQKAASGAAATSEAVDSASQNATDPAQFVAMATASNMFEIESSKLALEKATRPETKTFAQHMIDDHTKAGAEMQKAASADGITAPTALDEKHKAKIDSLAGKTGDDFDASYVAEQLSAHKEAVALFTGYANNGPAGSLKDFAAKTMPTLQGHLDQVSKLSAQ